MYSFNFSDKTLFTYGRIYQRISDAKNQKDHDSYVSVVHGVEKDVDLENLLNYLFDAFPSAEIILKRLNYGYELKITVKK